MSSLFLFLQKLTLEQLEISGKETSEIVESKSFKYLLTVIALVIEWNSTCQIQIDTCSPTTLAKIVTSSKLAQVCFLTKYMFQRLPEKFLKFINGFVVTQELCNEGEELAYCLSNSTGGPATRTTHPLVDSIEEQDALIKKFKRFKR